MSQPVEYPFLSNEVLSRLDCPTQRDALIICTDECGDSWLTTIGEFVRDNADCISDEDIMPVLLGWSSLMGAMCGPFEIRRVGMRTVTK